MKRRTEKYSQNYKAQLERWRRKGASMEVRRGRTLRQQRVKELPNANAPFYFINIFAKPLKCSLLRCVWVRIPDFLVFAEKTKQQMVWNKSFIAVRNATVSGWKKKTRRIKPKNLLTASGSRLRATDRMANAFGHLSQPHAEPGMNKSLPLRHNSS